MFANSKLLWAGWQVINFCGILALVMVSIVIYLVLHLRKIQNSPPGPWGAPIVGYLPFLGVPHKTFLELARTYGSMFSTSLGNQFIVVLSDYRLIREAFRREELTDRPKTPLQKALGGCGIINSEGLLWKNQRRFLHEKLRDLGVTFMGKGKTTMERRIKKEIHELVTNLNDTNGLPVNASPLLALGVSNVICGITMSIHFSNGDARFQRLNHLIEEGMRLFGEIHYGEYLSFYNYLPGKAKAQMKVIQNRDEMFKFYGNVINEHNKTLDMDNPRDLIDIYLIEYNKAKMENEKLSDAYIDLQLKQILGDLFSAGVETIKSSLLWMIVFMLRNPEVKRKVQEELDYVIGRNRLPTLEDMPNLPYTETTILETLRMSSVVPLATAHCPTKDVSFNGYKIPAGAQVIPLINSVHMDPTLWDEPEKFNPNRFVDDNGNIRRPEYFMPFGVGRRMCLGDVLAKMEMFMFFSSIMHQFDLQTEEGVAPPSLEGIVGATIAPQLFNVRFIPRTPLSDPPHVRNVGAH